VSSCEIFRGSLSYSLHFLFFFKKKKIGNAVSYLPWRAGKLESQTKRNARREKLFPVQVYSYNSYKIIEQPRIIIIQELPA